MFNKPVTVIARLPHGAFGDFRDVPSKQDHTYRKPFGINQLKAAIKYAEATVDDYREGHGNCAVYSVKIQVGGTIYERGFVEEVVEYANGGIAQAWPKIKIGSMDDFDRIAKIISKINADVAREMQAENDRLDAEFRAMHPEDFQ